MIRTRTSRLLTAGPLAAALGLALTACGGTSVEPDESALGPTETATSPAAPSPTPTKKATTKPKPPASSAAAPADGGDGEGDDEPATAGGGVCGVVGAEEVGAVLGVGVKGSAVPGETGCKFDQGGSRGMSVTILDKTAAEAGGMDGAKAEANSAVEGTPRDVGGLGSAAFVITGAMFGGPDVNAAGAVRIGDRIISVFLVQRSQLAEAKVRSLELDLLKLVARESA